MPTQFAVKISMRNISVRYPRLCFLPLSTYLLLTTSLSNTIWEKELEGRDKRAKTPPKIAALTEELVSTSA